MDFARLTLHDWQQFAEIDIEFHPRATIITGANGSGKTTILSLLARQRGWQHYSLATPKTDLVSKVMKYVSRWVGKVESSDRTIGTLTYTDQNQATLIVPPAASAQYNVEIHNQRPARFFYVPSHRQTFSYRRVGQISTVRKERLTAFEEIQKQPYKSTCWGRGRA